MVTVHLNGKDYKVDEKSPETLMVQLKSQGVPVVSACNGVGICQTCLIQVSSGSMTDKTACEEMMDLPNNQRLSCQCRPTSDCSIELIY